MTAILPLATLSAAALLSGAALVMAFFRRMPAVAVAYLSMVIASMSGMVAICGSQYWFWGVAAAIALGIEYLAPVRCQRGRALYTVGGSLAGAAIGLALGTQASVIIGSAVAAFLGYFAWGRTPAGRRSLASSPAIHIEEFAAIALPAVVNFAILMLIFAQLIQVQ